MHTEPRRKAHTQNVRGSGRFTSIPMMSGRAAKYWETQARNNIRAELGQLREPGHG
jgi:hypothetical protein